MSRTDRDLLQAALTALEVWARIDADDIAITREIRARLAEPEPEPVAWEYVLSFHGLPTHSKVIDVEYDLTVTSPFGRKGIDYVDSGVVTVCPLYRHPPSPVRLSDYEVSQLMNNSTGLATYKGYKLFADRIMDAMLEKNR